VHAVQRGPAAGLLAQVVLLFALAWTVGLAPVGWLVGLGCAVTVCALLGRGLRRHAAVGLGPADCVTLVRASLVVGVAALAATSSVSPGSTVSTTALVSLAVVALLLDAVDGQVARRTRTASALGATFDGEVDALLILVLSVHVAGLAGAWVLLMGAARYVFFAAGWVLPWMRATLPQRPWRKVVTAVVGIALVVAAADVLPSAVSDAGLVLAFALLAESFGRDVGWLWRERWPVPAVAEARSVHVGH
jgi:phosphatidylglycerophosphate synthase